MKRKLEIYTDGASRGNPGNASIGVIVKEDGKLTCEISKTIGKATNNVAEYTALIFALEEAIAMNAGQVKIYTDSELLYNQLIGVYKVKNETIKSLFLKTRQLSEFFEKIEIQCIPREQNREADKLANQALDKDRDKEQTKVVAFPSIDGREESPSSRG